MVVKRIRILAKSVKKGQHCIAGREIINCNATPVFGKWIRPVSQSGEGELSPSSCTLSNGQTPGIWDVVDVPLLKHEGSAAQPENWLVDPDRNWCEVAVPGNLPAIIVDAPPNLWDQSGGRGDRISADALAVLNVGQSLYLVRVSNFRVEFGWRSGKRRRRALFSYNGTQYDFSLTDPEIERRYCPVFPKPDDGVKAIRLSGVDCPWLCVSLTPLFKGDHYKIVATVIESLP